MSSVISDRMRLLPFDRDEPGSWERWEGFWLDFLNSRPLLPWPGSKAIFKRVKFAETFGAAGGPQDGIDVRARMDDGSILVVQCKDRPGLQPKEGKAAMDMAEEKYPGADAYFLAVTGKKVSSGIQKEADQRERWLVIGRETLSSWFLSGSILPLDEQVKLVKRHFRHDELKALFPTSGDDLLVTTDRFFSAFKRAGALHRHDACLQGEKTRALANEIARDLGGKAGPRVVILTATGGQGKSRFLKAVAEKVESNFPQRIVRIQNDAADAEAEDHGLRAADLDKTCVFIDDAHRLENLRPRLLRELAEHPGATVMIAARPNSLEPLKRKLLDARFTDAAWKHVALPPLDHADLRALALEILGESQDGLAAWLADQSKDCALVCTVGAELFKSGKIHEDLMGSPDFQRRVFDHLRDSVLDSICEGDPAMRKNADRCLRVLAMVSPIGRTPDTTGKLAGLLKLSAWDVDELLSNLRNAGLLRFFRQKIRVVPDLLADHLVYETAHGTGKLPSLVREVIEIFGGDAFANVFGNLAEAEWRARQDGKGDNYLDNMWKSVGDRLLNPDDFWIHGLMDAWGRFAVFQPERTLELATMVLEQERTRLAAGRPAKLYDGTRYDPLAFLLTKLSDLIAPIAFHHPQQRQEALELLWETGGYKQGNSRPNKTLPAAWQKIADAASFRYRHTAGPEGTFLWLKSWAKRPQGKALIVNNPNVFLSQVASQWFSAEFWDSWLEGEAMVHATHAMPNLAVENFRTEVLDWLEYEIIPRGDVPCWSALGIVYRAGGKSSRRFRRTQQPPVESDSRTRLIERALKILKGILGRFDNPVIRLSIWQYVSGRAAAESSTARKKKWIALRDSISRDVPFQLARLGSSFHIHEWNHERLQTWEKERDYQASAEWWSELSREVVIELRQLTPTLQGSLAVVDQVSNQLEALDERQSWEVVADSWARHFPNERADVVRELLLNPDHLLLPCLGYFVAPRQEAEQGVFESFVLQALSHKNPKVRRAILHRLSWRDVKHSDEIGKRLEELASCDDPVAVSEIADFLAWNEYDPTPHFQQTLAALNCELLPPRSLCRLGSAITHLIEYAKHPVGADLLRSYFARLERIDEFEKAFPEQVMEIFHREYPEPVFRLYLNRILASKPLSWGLDGWSLPELGKHPDYEAMAKDVFHLAIRADDDTYYPARKLFDAAVARVRPALASSWLLKELNRVPLERIVELTGCGNGSLVYEVPDFTRKLLERIAEEPPAEAKELYRDLVHCAVPRSWGWTDGELNEEYLWARDGAAKLSEEYRAYPLLHGFYCAIMKNQEELVTHVRRRHDDEFEE